MVFSYHPNLSKRRVNLSHRLRNSCFSHLSTEWWTLERECINLAYEILITTKYRDHDWIS